MRQRHLTADATELIARNSIVRPTGVSKCGSHMYTCAERPFFLCVFVSLGAQVMSHTIGAGLNGVASLGKERCSVFIVLEQEVR